MKAKETDPFGKLAGDYHIPVGSFRSPYIIASPIGSAIKSALRRLPEIHPALRLYQYALMPDHLHIVIATEHELDEPIGRKIAIFKSYVNKLAQCPHVFDFGFNDQIMHKSRNLDAVFRYLKENPYRLAVRMACPDFFRRVSNITIGGRSFNAYGNINLLRNPFKEQVVVHRRDDADIRSKKIERWMHTAANGGVLVSPFISKDEKEVRRMADEIDSRIILISNEYFGERGKPTGHDFNRCSTGNLIILTPTVPAPPLSLSREACVAMNSIAEELCGGWRGGGY